MLFTDKVLEFFMQNDDNENQECIELTERDFMKEEIASVVQEMSTYHADSNEYGIMADNLKKLVESYSLYERAETERDKVSLQAEENSKRRYVNWDIVLPKLGGIVASVGLTTLWFAVEREHPLPMRIIQEVNALTVPRGL